MKPFILSFVLLFLTGAVLAQDTFETGITQYRSMDYEAAVATLRSVTAADKNNKIAWVYFGAALLRSSNTKEAAKAFRKGRAGSQDLTPGDDTPLRITNRTRVRYTEAARERLVTGRIKLAVEFRSDGTIGFVFPFQTLPDGLTENSIAAARGLTFEPATRNGSPVTTVAIIEHTFDIH
ncbi:MAG: energy transducer TonB [Chloracidobacterium sp.]|nr:energy transducer TonB [Chloracidobacterium sp.]MCC6824745.1 energy transducer TonB [Acidobacteriota bacterium]MCO5334258.1 energy transducer TonB [Pyrinomonadaceae bacterium]